MMARLADFGLAQFASHKPPEHTASQTSTIGQTATIRGTLAYLPDEYVRNGKLGTAVDVYSFGVVRHCGKCCLLVQTKELFRFRRELVPKRCYLNANIYFSASTLNTLEDKKQKCIEEEF